MMNELGAVVTGSEFLHEFARAWLTGSVLEVRDEPFVAAVPELQSLFDQLIAADDPSRAEAQLRVLGDLLENDSAYAVYEKSRFRSLNRIRELALGMK